MEYRKLGQTDLRVSRLGFGCWAIGGHGYGAVDDDESIRAIRKALDMGINFFDTADVYGFGHSEEILSTALGSKRKDVVVATKFGVSWDETGRTFYDCSPQRTIEALEGSLRRLKVDSIPLYQIHWYDNVTPLNETMAVLRKCQEEGKIRHIGCSNLSPALLIYISKMSRVESFQCPFHILQRKLDKEIAQCSRKLNLSIITYNVLARGLLSGKYGIDLSFGEGDTRPKDPNFQGVRLIENLRIVKTLGKLAASYGKTSSQVAIRWVLDNPHVTSAIVGMKTASQVEENMGALGWSLKKEDGKLMSAW